MIMVDQKLEKLINNIQKEHSDYFAPASDEDISKLRKLFNKYDLEKVIDFYRLYQPAEIPSTCLLDIEGIFRECCDLAPCAYLYKFGVFPIATTIGGNVVCFDANDVVDGEPSVLYADHDFCFYDDEADKIEISGEVPARVIKEKGWELDFNYENIKDCLFKFDERFSDFIINLLQDEYGNIEKYVTANRGEYV